MLSKEFRPPAQKEMDAIYMMGYDAWAEGQTEALYLERCRTSQKYKAGNWLVLCINGIPISSLLIHNFGQWVAFQIRGIGSLATQPAYRGLGYAHEIIKYTIGNLSEIEKANVIFLYSDINPAFYQSVGFMSLPQQFQKEKDSVLMAYMLPIFDEAVLNNNRDKIPRYF